VKLPALALLDAVARLQTACWGDAQSHQQDSFSDGCSTARTTAVPEVLATPEGAIPVPPVLCRAITPTSPAGAASARWN
jgi:tRNA (guanine37-N1)-methyltransferase